MLWKKPSKKIVAKTEQNIRLFQNSPTNMSIPCPNPDCPAAKTPDGNIFSTERGLGTHLQRSTVCDEWVDSHPDYDSVQPPFPIPPPPHSWPSPPTEELEAMDVDDEPDNDEPAFRFERVPGAAVREPLRFGTEWEHRKAKERVPGCPWFPFISAEAYDFVQWAVQTKQTLADVDALLKTRYVR